MSLGNHTRRQFLRHSALLSAGVALLGSAQGVLAATNDGTPAKPITQRGDAVMLDNPDNRQGDFADVNGAHIFYQMTGKGTPMFLTHGYPLSGALFSRVRDALSTQYQVITPDLRGYGKSTAPGTPDNIATYAQDNLALMDKLGVKQAIIGGHSMGGPITLEMYKQAPDRFKGMILIDTNAEAASTIEAGLWGGFTAEAQNYGISMMYINFLMATMLTGESRMNQPELVTYLTQVVKAATVNAAIGGAKALGNRPSYMSMLSQIKVPTLVYVGLADGLYPFEISKMMSQAIPNSTLAIIPGGAHAAIFEVPDLSSRTILNWAAGKALGTMPGMPNTGGGGLARPAQAQGDH